MDNVNLIDLPTDQLLLKGKMKVILKISVLVKCKVQKVTLLDPVIERPWVGLSVYILLEIICSLIKVCARLISDH